MKAQKGNRVISLLFLQSLLCRGWKVNTTPQLLCPWEREVMLYKSINKSVTVALAIWHAIITTGGYL
jgi:hypothetical protein